MSAWTTPNGTGKSSNGNDELKNCANHEAARVALGGFFVATCCNGGTLASMQKSRLVVRINEDDLRELRRECDARAVNMSALVRRLVRQWVDDSRRDAEALRGES